MVRRRQAWQKANPDREVLIQFNEHENIKIIGTISDAMKNGFVVCNDAGRDLIQSLWLLGEEEPTFTMVNLAIHLNDDTEQNAEASINRIFP